MPRKLGKTASNSRRSAKRKSPLQLGLSYKRRLRNLGLALLVVVATAFSIVSILIFQKLSHSLASASSGIELRDSLSFDNRFNIALGLVDDFSNESSLIKSLYILTVETASRSVSIIKLPINLEVDNLGNFGQNKIYSLYGLANLNENKDLNFISKVLQQVFAIPIDGFILVDSKGYTDLSLKLGKDLGLSKIKEGDYIFYAKHVVDIPLITSRLKTNIGPLLLLDLFNKVIFTRFNSFNLMDSDNNFLVDSIYDNFMDSKIEEEGSNIILLNGTRVPLFASSKGKQVLHIGGKILETGNAPGDVFPKSMIIAKDLSSYTVTRLSGIFNITDVRGFDSLESNPKFSPYTRSDLIVVFGLDSLKN